MCIAKTTTTVAHRSLCNKLQVKQLMTPLRSKCTTFIEEPIYRPRFRKHDWEQSSLWRKIFGRIHDAWQMSYIGKRFVVSLALAWYMFQDLENPYVFIEGIDAISGKDEETEEQDEETVDACSFYNS